MVRLLKQNIKEYFTSKNDNYFMSIALKEAKRGIGFTSPNPMVGAVVVKNNKIISTGYHERDGEAHAEVNALNRVDKNQLAGSTLYVTLEPCCHYGRTPPCTDLIIKSKISRVVIANKDIDPRVKDKSIDILKKAGISVTTGVLESEAYNLNSIYFFYKQNRRPYVVLKAAVTLDGKIATFENDSKWISNEKSREIVHKLRLRLKAIAIGHRTIVIDNPSLNCRLKGYESKPVDKIIFSNEKEINYNFARNDGKVYIASKTTTVNRDTFIDFCIERGIDSILVEGGSRVYTWFLENNLVDRVFLFYKPSFLGSDALNIIKEQKIKKIDFLKELTLVDIRLLYNNFLVELSNGEPICLLD